MSQVAKSCDDPQLGPLSNLPLEIRQTIFDHTIPHFKRPEDVGLGYILDPFIEADFRKQRDEFKSRIKVLREYGVDETGAGWVDSIEREFRGEWESCMSEMIDKDVEVWYKWWHLGVVGARQKWNIYTHFKRVVEAAREDLVQTAISAPRICAATGLYEMGLGKGYANDPLRFREEAIRKGLEFFRYARLEMIAGISRIRGPMVEVLIEGADKSKVEDRILQLRDLESGCQTRRSGERIGLRSKSPWWDFP